MLGYRQEPPMLAWLAFIALFIVPVAYLAGRYTAGHAKAKGRSERAWFFWGAVLFPLFPFPGIIVDMMPSRSRQIAVN
jgi:membrane protease YdiL (CAAX protease family)